MKIVFDIKQMKPACALIQAQLDGLDNEHLWLFPPETWLLVPTDHMAVYNIDESQLHILVQKVKDMHG